MSGELKTGRFLDNLITPQEFAAAVEKTWRESAESLDHALVLLADDVIRLLQTGIFPFNRGAWVLYFASSADTVFAFFDELQSIWLEAALRIVAQMLSKTPKIAKLNTRVLTAQKAVEWLLEATSAAIAQVVTSSPFEVVLARWAVALSTWVKRIPLGPLGALGEIIGGVPAAVILQVLSQLARIFGAIVAVWVIYEIVIAAFQDLNENILPHPNELSYSK